MPVVDSYVVTYARCVPVLVEGLCLHLLYIYKTTNLRIYSSVINGRAT